MHARIIVVIIIIIITANIREREKKVPRGFFATRELLIT
jgi:hypothetical protein